MKNHPTADRAVKSLDSKPVVRHNQSLAAAQSPAFLEIGKGEHLTERSNLPSEAGARRVKFKAVVRGRSPVGVQGAKLPGKFHNITAF